jgi:hypothetical protein
MKSSIYEAQKRYVEKNLNTGQRRVNVWVPEKNVEEMKSIAASMRSGKWSGITNY